MTPRDHYLCAALQLCSSVASQEIIAAATAQTGCSGARMLAETAAVFADAMATVACQRWGHTDGERCERCGAPRGAER